MFSDTRYSIDEMCMIVSGTLRFLTSIPCRVLSAAAKRHPKGSQILLDFRQYLQSMTLSISAMTNLSTPLVTDA